MNTPTRTTVLIDAQAFIDSLPDAALILDEEGNVQLSNRALEKQLGYSPRELHERNIGFLSSADTDELLVLRAVNDLSADAVARLRNGKSIRVQVTCAALESSDPPRRLVIIRSAQQLLELHPRLMEVSRLATLGEMAAGIAHELNQPLSAIANYAQAAKWMLDSPPHDAAEIKESLAEITTQALRAGSIIKRLRALIQKGESQRETLIIDDVINEIKDLLATEARLKSVRLIVLLEPDLPPVVVDRIQIQQVLLSLIRNAVEALENTAREHREVKVRTALRRDGSIEVAVADTGPGVTVAIEDRMFLPFSTEKQSGAGLGLPMSKTIVEAHNGALVYRPNEPRGACFSFHLPAARGR